TTQLDLGAIESVAQTAPDIDLFDAPEFCGGFMKKLLILSLVAVAGIAAAAPEYTGTNLNLVHHFNLGQAETFAPRLQNGDFVYNNTTNFTGFGVNCGGATGLTSTTGTVALGDDCNMIASTNGAGGVLSILTFSVSNSDTTA